MNQQHTCPHCGRSVPTNAPGGICPQCLLKAGLGNGSQAESAPHRARPTADIPVVESPLPGPFVPPDVTQLAELFPQLEILGLLGHGGMGAVYKARQIKLDRLVALKIIRPDASHDPSFAERFHREAKALARLSHPHIVAVHDIGEVLYAATGHADSQPLYYFIMEYVDGINLRQVIAAGSLQPAQALAIVPQICEALQYAHDEDVVHRDIKPENILIDSRGRVKIADFGLAKLTGRAPQPSTITGTHQVMGTPRYMAPEQMEGARAVDHRADIYSLGVVFYEMLTGEVPAGHFEPPSRKAEVDVRLDDVVLRALAREPERRYQHASDVKVDVESISGSAVPAAARNAVAARRVGDSARTARLSRVAVAGATLAVIALLTGVQSIYFVLNDPPPLDVLIVVLIFATIIIGLTSTLLGAVSTYQIRLAQGTLVGFGMACWSLLCVPLLAVDAAIFGVILALVKANGVIPSMSASLVICAVICVPSNMWIVRRVWRGMTGHEAGRGVGGRLQAESPRVAAAVPSPAWFAPAALGLFAVGWIVAGALRNLGPAGLAIAIGLMALITLAVVKWRTKEGYAPRSKLEVATGLRRVAMLLGAALLFVSGLLAVETSVVSMLDWHYFSRIGVVPGVWLTLERSGELADFEITDDEAQELDHFTRLHRQATRLALTRGAFLAPVAILLLTAAVTAAIAARRSPCDWSHSWRPACQISLLLIVTLPVVGLACFAWDQKHGWGTSPPHTFRSPATVERFAQCVEQWAGAHGYERQLNIYGTSGKVHFASYLLLPRWSLDRWQYTRSCLVRPRPPMSVTCVRRVAGSPQDSEVLVELPWVGLDSPEESDWPMLVGRLEQALRTAQSLP